MYKTSYTGSQIYRTTCIYLNVDLVCVYNICGSVSACISFHVVMVNGKYLLFMGIVISIKRVEKERQNGEGIKKKKRRKEEEEENKLLVLNGKERTLSSWRRRPSWDCRRNRSCLRSRNPRQPALPRPTNPNGPALNRAPTLFSSSQQQSVYSVCVCVHQR